jgi:hypothetical protein
MSSHAPGSGTEVWRRPGSPPRGPARRRLAIPRLESVEGEPDLVETRGQVCNATNLTAVRGGRSPKAAPPAWVRRLGRGRGPADDSARTPAAHERGGRPAQPSQIDQVYVPPPPRSSGASPPCGAKPGHRLGDDQREYRSVRRPHGDFVAQDCDYEVNSGRDGKCGNRPGPRTRAAGWYSPRTQATSPPYPVRCRDDGFLSGEPTARTHLRRA